MADRNYSQQLNSRLLVIVIQTLNVQMTRNSMTYVYEKPF